MRPDEYNALYELKQRLDREAAAAFREMNTGSTDSRAYHDGKSSSFTLASYWLDKLLRAIAKENEEKDDNQ